MTGKEKNGNIWLWGCTIKHLFLKWLITQSDRVYSFDHLRCRDEAFAGLESLEWLKLEDNSLSRLGGELVFPRGLKGLEIHNNPWECDCSLQEFTRWLQLTSVPRVAEPLCHAPPRLQVQPCLSPKVSIAISTKRQLSKYSAKPQAAYPHSNVQHSVH